MVAQRSHVDIRNPSKQLVLAASHTRRVSGQPFFLGTVNIILWFFLHNPLLVCVDIMYYSGVIYSEPTLHKNKPDPPMNEDNQLALNNSQIQYLYNRE